MGQAQCALWRACTTGPPAEAPPSGAQLSSGTTVPAAVATAADAAAATAPPVKPAAGAALPAGLAAGPRSVTPAAEAGGTDPGTAGPAHCKGQELVTQPAAASQAEASPAGAEQPGGLAAASSCLGAPAAAAGTGVHAGRPSLSAQPGPAQAQAGQQAVHVQSAAAAAAAAAKGGVGFVELMHAVAPEVWRSAMRLGAEGPQGFTAREHCLKLLRSLGSREVAQLADSMVEHLYVNRGMLGASDQDLLALGRFAAKLPRLRILEVESDPNSRSAQAHDAGTGGFQGRSVEYLERVVGAVAAAVGGRGRGVRWLKLSLKDMWHSRETLDLTSLAAGMPGLQALTLELVWPSGDTRLAQNFSVKHRDIAPLAGKLRELDFICPTARGLARAVADTLASTLVVLNVTVDLLHCGILRSLSACTLLEELFLEGEKVTDSYEYRSPYMGFYYDAVPQVHPRVQLLDSVRHHIGPFARLRKLCIKAGYTPHKPPLAEGRHELSAADLLGSLTSKDRLTEVTLPHHYWSDLWAVGPIFATQLPKCWMLDLGAASIMMARHEGGEGSTSAAGVLPHEECLYGDGEGPVHSVVELFSGMADALGVGGSKGHGRRLLATGGGEVQFPSLAELGEAEQAAAAARLGAALAAYSCVNLMVDLPAASPRPAAPAGAPGAGGAAAAAAAAAGPAEAGGEAGGAAASAHRGVLKALLPPLAGALHHLTLGGGLRVASSGCLDALTTTPLPQLVSLGFEFMGEESKGPAGAEPGGAQPAGVAVLTRLQAPRLHSLSLQVPAPGRGRFTWAGVVSALGCGLPLPVDAAGRPCALTVACRGLSQAEAEACRGAVQAAGRAGRVVIATDMSAAWQGLL